jgi:hypothetical protein
MKATVFSFQIADSYSFLSLGLIFRLSPSPSSRINREACVSRRTLFSSVS